MLHFYILLSIAVNDYKKELKWKTKIESFLIGTFMKH